MFVKEDLPVDLIRQSYHIIKRGLWDSGICKVPSVSIR